MHNEATSQEVDSALKEAYVAFLSVKNFNGKKRGAFLRAIADEIDSLGQSLVTTVTRETALPEARVISERARTTGHMRMFASLIEEGSWVDARIDTAAPDRTPAPKPDLRKMLVPIGPVVVFGSANFPLAYSTAGGDTASALAAGCPVIVKAHPAHADTSELVAGAIQKAALKTGMPRGTFQHLHDSGFNVGKALVQHPLTKAVGFTGSFAGGKALFDLANQRTEPIPVFAEMSSINPVILLPETLARQVDQTAEKLAASITLNVGQFCTDPGLIISLENEGLERFIHALGERIKKVAPGTMLHKGIAENYNRKLKEMLERHAVHAESQSEGESGALQGKSLIASTSAPEFLKNPALAEEVFGPFSLIVKCKDILEMNAVVNHLHGQLTATVIGDESELKNYTSLFNTLKEKAGRLIVNGVPTGVEVCVAMQHGGPFPATTDSRFTAVGTDAIKRFARPVAFQNFPDSLLPDELKAMNPLGIWRMLDNEWQKR
jgi:alpha-ketoglutaric semialdehyde dehydrogenase